MAATVTLEAGKRSVETTLEVVDDEPFEVPETLTLEAAAAGYNSSSVVTIVIYDDNYTPLTLTADPLSVAEPWGRSTVTVSVPEGKEPATDTVVSIFAFPSSTATKEIHYTLETELTILGRHRSAETTLQVTDDAVDEGKERTKLIAHGDASSGLGQSSPLGIPLIDDDTAGVTVTPASLSLTEGGTTGTYQVRLDSEPTHRVLVTIDSDNPDLQVTPAAVRFAPGNWSIPQAVTVEVAHDDGYDDESGTLTHEATGGDPDYEGIAIDDVTVTVDDELPPLTLTAATTSVSEPDGTTTLTVSVPEGGAPDADTTIGIWDLGYARQGKDFTVGTLTIEKGDLSDTATLQVIDDTVYEGTEVIWLQAAKEGYKISPVLKIPLEDNERNQAPVVSPPLPDLTTNVGAASTVSLSSHFSDPEGHDLVYTANSSEPSKVTVSVTNYPNSNRGTLTLTGKAIGSSTITVTASDGSLSTTKTLTARVDNRAPVCSFSTQTIDVNTSTDLGVNAHCTDADGHSMTFTSASSADTSIATVSRRNSNATVRIHGVAVGSTEVTVTVSDGHGGSTTKTFDVNVVQPNRAPVISRISPNLGQTDTRATIYGANFGTDEGSVSFGGSSADINSWNDTWISVLVPLHLSVGTVSVSVTTAHSAGSKTSNSVSFRVTGSPLRSDEEEECEDEKDCAEDEGEGEEKGEEAGEEESGDSGETEEDPSGG